MPHNALMLGLGGAFATFLGGAVVTSQTSAPRAAAPAASAASAHPEAGLACEVREVRTGRILTLEASIRGERPVSGDYRFAVTSRSAGGASRSAQNGTFELEPKGSAVLGEIGLDAGAAYEAKLTLTLPNDELVCLASN